MTVLRLIRALMVGERCPACKRVRGYRKAKPEETLGRRFHQLFEIKTCYHCLSPGQMETWAVWWELPVG